MITLIKIQAKNLLTFAAAASSVLMIASLTMAVTPGQGDPTNLPTTFESMVTDQKDPQQQQQQKNEKALQSNAQMVQSRPEQVQKDKSLQQSSFSQQALPAGK